MFVDLGAHPDQLIARAGFGLRRREVSAEGSATACCTGGSAIDVLTTKVGLRARFGWQDRMSFGRQLPTELARQPLQVLGVLCPPPVVAGVGPVCTGPAIDQLAQDLQLTGMHRGVLQHP